MSSMKTSAAHRSDLSRAFTEDGTRKTYIGGQALLGGVMMRGHRLWAAAVRTPAGSIYTEEHLLSHADASWHRIPLVRGCLSFFEAFVIGYKALEISILHSDVALEEDDDSPDTEGTNVSQNLEQDQEDSQKAESKMESEAVPDGNANDDFGTKDMIFSLGIGTVLGLLLFIVAPAFIANVCVGEYDHATFAWNLVDGIVRVAIFIGYIWAIGNMSDMKELFQYHGAEHKTIHCYEHGLPLTPENASQFPRLHVRCGTAFLIMVMIVAILVYTLLPVNSLIAAFGIADGIEKFLFVIGTRIVLLPLIAGISYEITVRWAGMHPENPLVKIILWPGLQMQYLTTRPPTNAQIECAIAAMKCVIKKEEPSVSDSVQSHT